MRELVALQFPFARILTWAEPTDDGELYAVMARGRLIHAPSVALLISALQALPPPRVEWSAACNAAPLRLAA